MSTAPPQASDDMIDQWMKERKSPKYRWHECPICGGHEHQLGYVNPMRLLFDFAGDLWALTDFDISEFNRQKAERERQQLIEIGWLKA